MNTERERFESWLLSVDETVSPLDFFLDENGDYFDESIYSGWVIWQHQAAIIAERDAEIVKLNTAISELQMSNAMRGDKIADLLCNIASLTKELGGKHE
jgi:hypothetical protein